MCVIFGDSLITSERRSVYVDKTVSVVVNCIMVKSFCKRAATVLNAHLHNTFTFAPRVLCHLGAYRDGTDSEWKSVIDSSTRPFVVRDAFAGWPVLSLSTEIVSS